ncbi:hypothetical protein ACT7V1_001224 [Salmonella enterica subsp. enterica]
MELSTISEALIGGLVGGTIAAGFIRVLFIQEKFEWVLLACVVLTTVFTFFFGHSIPNPFMMISNMYSY